MTAFSTVGYLGDKSPNRADALIWALTELFPGVVNPKRKRVEINIDINPNAGWMAM